MKVLMLSTDRAIFENDSAVKTRLLEQASLVSELHVVVFTPKGEKFVTLHPGKHITIYPTSSPGKFAYLSDAYALGRSIIKKDGHRDKWLITTQDPFETGAIGYLLARMLRVPFHVQLHTDPFSAPWRESSFSNRLRYMLSLFLLRAADGVRVVSARVKKRVEAIGVPPERVTQVPIYTDVGHFANTKPAFDLHSSYPQFTHIILSIGRLTREKNFHGLIRAFVRVRKIHPTAMLLIIGSGEERDNLVSLVRSLDLEKSVTILPWARDVVSYYKTCDVYVQPSLYEGWGLAVVEAMASGAPVVMTDVGCAGEIVRDEETGLVVSPRDEAALVEAIVRILNDKTLAKTFVENGKKKVEALATKAETLLLYKTSWDNAYQHGRKRFTKSS